MTFTMLPLAFANDLKATLHGLRQEFIGHGIPRQLFHYTSWRGLLGIIDSRSIRATWIQSQGDYAELQYGADLVYDEIRETRQRGVGSFAQEVLSRVVYMMRIKTKHTYLTCFCANPASGFHSQRYGNYCLTFETNRAGEPLLRPSLPNVNVQYCRVIYGEQPQRAAVQKTIAAVLEALARNTQGEPQGPWVTSNAEFFARIASELLVHLTIAFKRPSFANEEEWRIVVSPHIALSSSAPDEHEAAFELLVQTEGQKRYVELYGPKITGHPSILPMPFSALAVSASIDDPTHVARIREILAHQGCGQIEVSKGS